MKKRISFLLVLAFMLSLAVPATHFAPTAYAENAEPQTYVTLDYYKGLNDGGSLPARLSYNGAETLAQRWDTTNTRLLVNNNTATSLLGGNLAIPSSAIDTTQPHWLRGKTMEIEASLVSFSHNNPTFSFAVYNAGTEEGQTSHASVWSGCGVWLNAPSGIASYNYYGSGTQGHTTPLIPGNWKVAGATVKFKFVETETTLYQYFDDGIGVWQDLASYDVTSFKYDRGEPVFGLRTGDTWAIQSFAIYDTPEAESVELGEKVLFSQANFHAAYQGKTLSSLFTVVQGVAPTVYGYNDTTDDMLVMSRANSDNWSILKLNIPAGRINTAEDHWLLGKTVQFEVVYFEKEHNTTNSNGKTFLFIPYSSAEDPGDGRSNSNYMEYGAVLWHSNKTGMLCAVNGDAGTHKNTSYRVAQQTVKDVSSIQFRITETAEKMMFYYYNAASSEWVAINEGIAASELVYVDGSPVIGIRGREYYGIRNFIIYENSAETYGVQNTDLYGEVGSECADVRFIATVNGLGYTQAGFEISVSYGSTNVPAKSYSTTVAYRSLMASDKNGTIGSVNSPEGTYFIAIAVKGVPKAAGKVTFLVRPYVVRMDSSVAYSAPYEVIFENGVFVSATICTDGR